MFLSQWDKLSRAKWCQQGGQDGPSVCLTVPSINCRYLPFVLDVMPAPSSHPNGHMKGSDTHACHSGAAYRTGSHEETCSHEACGLSHHCTTAASVHQAFPCQAVVHSECPPHSPTRQVALWSPRLGGVSGLGHRRASKSQSSIRGPSQIALTSCSTVWA